MLLAYSWSYHRSIEPLVYELVKAVSYFLNHFKQKATKCLKVMTASWHGLQPSELLHLLCLSYLLIWLSGSVL